MSDHSVFLELKGVAKVGPKGGNNDPVTKWATKKNWIVCDYFQWGARRSGSTSSNSGESQGGRAAYFDVTFSKKTDQSTAELLNRCSSGETFTTAIFYFYGDDPSAKNAAVDKVKKKLTLHNASVAGVDVGTEMVDRVTFHYSSFEWDIMGYVVAEEKTFG